MAILFFTFIWKVKFLYILGHEISHYVMGYLFRRRLGKFTFSKNHASVQIENPNFLILMAPYITPIWAIFFGVFFYILSFCFSQINNQLFLILMAIFLAHHIVMTIYVLSFEQSDLKKYGKFFSLSFIIVFNLGLIYFGIASLNIGLQKGIFFFSTNLYLIVQQFIN